MILVTEAGYQGMVALSACRTLPVSASTTSSASACTARGVTTASAVARKIQFNEEARSSGRRKCTFPFRSFETRLEKRRSCRSNVRVSSVSGTTALRQRKPIPAWRARTEPGRLNRGRNRRKFGDVQTVIALTQALFGSDSSSRALLHHELGLREFRKASAFGHQFIESSSFDHAAVVKHEDAGGVANGRKPVRDHKGGAAFHHLIEG